MDVQTELHQALIKSRDEILSVCDAMDETQRRAPIVDGQWSAHDLIGHLSYCEGDTLDHLTQTFKEGRPRKMPSDTSIDDLNARQAAKRKDWTYARLRAEFENTRNALIQRIDGMSESDLQFQVPSPWMNDERILSLETLIREDVLQHGAEHLAELEHDADHHR